MAVDKKYSLSIDETVMMAIVRSSERFKRESSAIFSGYGLSFSQYNVLRLLDSRPDGRDSITEISRRLLVSTPNMSGIGKRLEKAGFVDRYRDSSDERRTILSLKPAGSRVLAEIQPRQEENVKSFLAACPPGLKQAFLDLLNAMLDPSG